MDYSQYKQLEFHRKFWRLFGAEIFINDPASKQELGYIKMKAWKLREDIRVFTSRAMQQELVQIHARQIIDFGATYDVTDSASTQLLYSARRKGLKSTFVRDHWDLVDVNSAPFGTVQETSSGLAIARRYLEIIPYVGDILGLVFAFVPQTYQITIVQPDGSNALAGTITHRKNPIIVKMLLDTSAAQVTLHPYITLSITSLLAIIDANKNS